MKKLWVPVLLTLAACCFLAGRSVGTPDSLPAPPQIVRRVELTNQTAPIPTTTLLTPSHNGLYRVSSYISTTDNPLWWPRRINWTDDVGPQMTVFGTFGNEIFIEAVAGQPISYAVDPNGGQAPYSLYITLERVAP
jgi:hypothetical protein